MTPAGVGIREPQLRATIAENLHEVISVQIAQYDSGSRGHPKGLRVETEILAHDLDSEQCLLWGVSFSIFNTDRLRSSFSKTVSNKGRSKVHIIVRLIMNRPRDSVFCLFV